MIPWHCFAVEDHRLIPLPLLRCIANSHWTLISDACFQRRFARYSPIWSSSSNILAIPSVYVTSFNASLISTSFHLSVLFAQSVRPTPPTPFKPFPRRRPFFFFTSWLRCSSVFFSVPSRSFISTRYLNPRPRYYYFRFLKTNGRHSLSAKPWSRGTIRARTRAPRVSYDILVDLLWQILTLHSSSSTRSLHDTCVAAP